MRQERAILLWALALALLTIPIYAVRRRHLGPDPLAAEEHGSFVLGSFLRDWFYWFLGPAVRLSLATRLSPRFWNLSGVGCGTAAGGAFAFNRPALAGWAVLLGGVVELRPHGFLEGLTGLLERRFPIQREHRIMTIPGLFSQALKAGRSVKAERVDFNQL